MALLLFLACWLLLCARGVAHDSGGVGQAGLASRKGQKAAAEGRRCPQVPSEGRYVQALLISHGSIAIRDTQDSAASHMDHLCSPCAHIAEPLHSILHHLQASPVLCCHPRPLLDCSLVPAGASHRLYTFTAKTLHGTYTEQGCAQNTQHACLAVPPWACVLDQMRIHTCVECMSKQYSTDVYGLAGSTAASCMDHLCCTCTTWSICCMHACDESPGLCPIW